MKIVVLGALGHIGSSLIREIPLLVDTSEIILVDNMSKDSTVSRALEVSPKINNEIGHLQYLPQL